MNRPVTAPVAVDYPCSDDRPMAESDFQLDPLIDAITTLRTRFHHRGQAYVAGDTFLYHEECNPPYVSVVAPCAADERRGGLSARGKCPSAITCSSFTPAMMIPARTIVAP